MKNNNIISKLANMKMKQWYSHLLIFIFANLLIISSCKKTDGTPQIPFTFGTDTTINSNNLIFTDTPHTVTNNDVSIQYNHSSPCNPSVEIFFFTAKTYNFTDSNNATYKWTIQDQSLKDIQYGKNIQHFFAQQANAAKVLLQVYDHTGNLYDSAVAYVNAFGNRANNRQVTFSVSLQRNDSPNIVQLQSLAIQPLDGSIDSWYWDLGDGQTDGRPQFVHPFPTRFYDTNYTVKLFIHNTSGCKDSVIRTINVPALFGGMKCSYKYSSKDVCTTTGEVFTFVADTTGIPKGAYYMWDFKDYTQLTTSTNTITHQYASPNKFYGVELKIHYNGRDICSYTDSLVAKGYKAKPIAYFYPTVKYDTITNLPNSNYWFFNCLSVYGNGNNLAAIHWDFGDGYGANPSQYNPSIEHHFPKLNVDTNYLVKMYITSTSSCSDTTQTWVHVPK